MQQQHVHTFTLKRLPRQGKLLSHSPFFLFRLFWGQFNQLVYTQLLRLQIPKAQKAA